MSHRNKFYSKYVSSFTSHLYGDISLENIEKQFHAWQSYFGEFLPKDKNVRILDLGCGNGGFVYWLQQIGYQNVEGFDASEEQIKIAEELGIKNIFQSKNIDMIDKYDIIFVKDVIEHFHKDEILNILNKIYKALKIGGVLIIQTPNAESPFGSRFRYYDFTHEISFTEGSIRQVLLISKFNNIKIYSQPPVVHGLKSLTRFILWKLIEMCLKFYLLIETGSAEGIFTQNLIAIAKK